MEATIQEVRRLTGGWKNLPPVHVVQDHKRLPVLASRDTEGLAHRGEVFLVGDQRPARVAQLLGHELLAHTGLRRILGRERWAGFMGAIADGARRGDPILERCREHVRSVYRDDRGELYLGTLSEADEMAACLGELLFDPATRPVLIEGGDRKRLRALARQLQREVLLLDIPADADEVVGGLLQAEDEMRDGLRGPAAWWYRAAMPAKAKPMGPAHPARSTAESAAMLEAERHRRQERNFGWDGSVLFLAVLTIIGCLGYWVLLILGIVRV